MESRMERPTQTRPWNELIPDALGLIFVNLSLQEKLTVVPRVCKAWRDMIRGPYCWQEIDIEDWTNTADSQNIDRMLQMLIARSGGVVTKLCASELRSETVDYVLENTHALKSLRLHRSDMDDAFVEQVSPKFVSITSLDLSYCKNFGAHALKCIGQHCKSLTWLRRNMHPINMSGNVSQDDEALAIAMSMPNLTRLEIAYMLIDTSSVLEILHNCLSLETLDLRGCWNVKLDDKYVKEKFPRLEILGPHVVDYFEKDRNWWEVCSDCSDSYYDSDSSDGLWDDVDTVEVRVFQGFGENTGYGWPSP